MKVTVKRTIEASSDVIWNYLGDFSNIHRFHPFLKSSHFINDSQTCEVGSTRQCDFKDGSTFQEQISEWVEGSHYTIDIVGSTGPIKEGSGTLGVTSIGTNKSEVYMTLDVVPPNKIAQPIMFLMFRYKVIPAILKKLEKLSLHAHQQKPLAA